MLEGRNAVISLHRLRQTSYRSRAHITGNMYLRSGAAEFGSSIFWLSTPPPRFPD